MSRGHVGIGFQITAPRMYGSAILKTALVSGPAYGPDHWPGQLSPIHGHMALEWKALSPSGGAAWDRA
jgi:hypothetical protein